MRRSTILLLAVLLLAPATIWAQSYAFDKGAILITGSSSAGFVSAGGDLRGNDRVSRISVDPAILYLFAPNIAIGGVIDFERESQGGETDTFVGIGPRVAYFFGDQSSRNYPFVSVDFTYYNQKDFYSETDFSFAAGVAFMVARNVAIMGIASYTLESLKPDGANDSISGNVFGIRFGVAGSIF